tara:strand:- start:111 stop:923 length:813 start_codon:yes stop_codon:yes gene_type:complete
MRISATGDVLVGTTDTSLFNNTTGGGFSVGSNGFTQIAKQGVDSADPVLILNQTGPDGEILRFYKDGTSVGSIGVTGGSIIFGRGDTALAVNDGLDSVYPINSTGAVRDAAIDLGRTAHRFKDAYLSGGVYLGGVGAANKLDDYEEGTWTPTVTGSTTAGAFTYAIQEGKYTKVGNLVNVSIAIQVTATATSPVGDVQITGLPITIANQFPSFSVGWSQNITFSEQLSAYGEATSITLRSLTSAGSGSNLGGGDIGSNFYLFISGTYQSA